MINYKETIVHFFNGTYRTETNKETKNLDSLLTNEQSPYVVFFIWGAGGGEAFYFNFNFLT